MLNFSSSACRVAPETGAAASAPASAAGRASAACWAPRKQVAVWRRTTCSPPARPQGNPVDQREDAAPHQASAVTRVQSGLVLVHYGMIFYFGPSLNKVLFSFPESCAVDPDCLADVEASDPARGSAGSSAAELLLRLLHVATRGQTEH